MKRKFYLLLLSCALLFTAKAQIFYSFKDSTGTYTSITGTYVTTKALSTGSGVASPAWDDGYANGITIPFTFTYNGVAYTKINVCTNGFATLGTAFTTTKSTTAPIYYSSPDLLGTNDPNDTIPRPILAPFWADLIFPAGVAAGNSSQGLSYTTTGTTPNRIFTIQWHNAGWDWSATAGTMDFQIKIFETTNVIMFVYNREAGAIVNGNGGTSNPASIGLSAKGYGLGNFISVSDSTNNATVSKFTESTITGRPNSGQYYIFTPVTPLTNDAAITKVYSTSVVSTVADPQNISALVTNGGTADITNLNVTLNITGANSFTDVQTIPTLSAGKSVYVTFNTFASTVNGKNTISVTVPADQDNTNNSGSTSQIVTLGTINYMSSLTPTGPFGQTSTTDFATLFTNPNTHSVNTILLNFADTANGSQPFSLSIWDATGTDANSQPGAPGNIIWSSSQPLTTMPGLMAIKTDSSISLTGDFFVDVTQTDTIPFDLGYENENPLRLGTFYVQNGNTNGFLDIGQSTLAFIKLDVGVQFDSVTTTPVSLLKFSGSKLNSSSNLLRWTTSTESNNLGFDVQRSSDGVNFVSIATVNSKALNGNSNISLDYTYQDNTASTGVNYYRLNQKSKNGTNKLSGIVSLRDNALFKIAAIYPNPVQSNMSLGISSPVALKASSVITDMTGKIMLTRNFDIFAGDNLINYDVNTLKAGSYVIKVTAADGSTQTQLFEKQ